MPWRNDKARSPLLASSFILPSRILHRQLNNNKKNSANIRGGKTKQKDDFLKQNNYGFHFAKSFEVAAKYGSSEHQSDWSHVIPVRLLSHPLLDEMIYKRPSKCITLDNWWDRYPYQEKKRCVSLTIEDKWAQNKPHRDILIEVGAPTHILKSLQILSGGYIEIENITTHTVVLARLFAIDRDGPMMDESFVLLPPSLHFQLGFFSHYSFQEASSTKLSIPSISCNHGYVRLRKYVCIPFRPILDSPSSSIIPVAKSVQILLVQSPDVILRGNSNYDVAIHNFFKIRRILRKGMIFGVCINPSSATHVDSLFCNFDKCDKNDTDLESSENEDDTFDLETDFRSPPRMVNCVPLVYFKVAKVIPQSLNYFVIDPSETILTQKGTVQSRVPYALEAFISESKHPKISQIIGLEKQFLSLTKILEPFIHPRTTHLAPSGCGSAVPTPSVLLYGPRGSGKVTVVRAVSKHLGMHLLEINACSFMNLSERKLEENVRKMFNKASRCVPVIIHLRRLSLLKGSDQQEHQKTHPHAIFSKIFKDFQRFDLMMVVSCTTLDEVGTKLRNSISHTICIGTPDLANRVHILKHFFQQLRHKSTSNAKNVNSLKKQTFSSEVLEEADQWASCTAGLTLAQIREFITDASNMVVCRQYSIPTMIENNRIMSDDFNRALGHVQEASPLAGGVAKIPNVKWEDVGGLENVKREILDTIELPLKYPHLFSSGMKQRSGVLLYGPPGTGKTLIAKAVATECSLNFISVKGPELLNMYIGESEKNVRDIFQKARDAKPAVLFFDELDSLVPARGQGSDSGGVMDRVVSQLLTEMDGMNSGNDVFIIGATNRPDLIDSALLRPGRLDTAVYLGVCENVQSQLKIMKALTRKFSLAADVDMLRVIEGMGFTLTGADFYALSSDALLHGMKRKIKEIEKMVNEMDTKEATQSIEGIAPDEYDSDNENNISEGAIITPHTILSQMNDAELSVEVCMQDFMTARKNISPSLSSHELAKYKQLQQKFAQRNKKKQPHLS